MPGKPDAARGKKTKKGEMLAKVKKARESAKKRRKAMTGKAVTGAAGGMGEAGLMAIARKIKPTGRLNAADLDRVQKMIRTCMGKGAKPPFKRGGKAKK